MPHPLSHKYPIPISQLCLVNTDVPAGVGAPPLDTTSCGGCNTKMYITTNLVQHLKAKHSEQTVCRVWEGTGERRGGQRQGKRSSVADVITWGQWASSDMGYKQSSCTIDSSASDWDDSTWFPAILYSGGYWFYMPSMWVRATIFSPQQKICDGEDFTIVRLRLQSISSLTVYVS